MTLSLFLTQALNGVQFGIMLFLMAAGLTLVFGIMNMVNLAHGSLYMMGAYFLAALVPITGNFFVAAVLAVAGSLVLGIAVELVALRTLYRRDHLDQVLCTFGLILFFNEIVRMIWGATALFVQPPDALSGFVQVLPGVNYPVYRLTIMGVGLAVAAFLYWLNGHTRLGMLIRAGASNRTMVGALGVNINRLYTLVFGLGAALAGLAGVMAGPILSVQSGMGDSILILTFVVIVIGGIGSIRGAFVASLLVGVVDTVGRVFLPLLLSAAFSPATASKVGPALASMSIYILMAAILFFRPQGLFAAYR
jgi:branched-chain amino acid transport system permease protein